MSEQTETMTPMMAQYFSVKENYKDCLLFYRLGDFYELFYDDAKIASEVLEITLTSRNKNAQNPVPMCGVPHHAAQEYIKTLVDKGYKIAICEQLEDAKLTKGMVKRDVVQVITPGTVLDPKNKDDKKNHYLASLIYAQGYHLAYVDIATGEIKVTSTSNDESLLNELRSLDIFEIVYYNLPDAIIKQLQQHFSYVLSKQEQNMDSTAFETILEPVYHKQQLEAVQLLLAYVNRTQKRSLVHLQPVQVYEINHFLKLDYNAKYNLELTESIRTKTKKGSLLWLLDETKTAMGGRMLRQWMEKPLIDKSKIESRQQKVANLMNHYFERMDLVQALKSVYDLERLVARVSFGSVNARDLIQLKTSLEQIPMIKEYLLLMNETGEWTDTLEQMDSLDHITHLIENAIIDEPPISTKEGGVIKNGYDELLDKYRDAMVNGKQWIANLQQQEREKTGIKTLKIGYNRVFGYYIEVTKGSLHLLPEGQYDRKQTLANAERFITPELKEKERIILEAEEKSVQLEYELFVSIREQIKQYSAALQLLAKQVASIDVLQSFAYVSEQYHYVKPILHQHQQTIFIKNGRHPVVEKVIGIHKYVPNDLVMSDDNTLLLITGPNMSGKSTFMRQLALTVIMAQMGCFVPADTAELPIFDRIFTRIGAADDLISGQSTFMVEMLETNQAIQYATEKSLLLFDEIGRGTATYDGMALAEAILRYVHHHVHAIALFSTHYHELTVLDKELKGLRNVHVGAIEENGELIFLHKLMEGPADKSYGLHVAQLAGLPKELLLEATHILERLEVGQKDVPISKEPIQEQVSLFEELELKEKDVLQELRTMDMSHLTPMDVMIKMNELQKKLM
ncbi:DNA mismatch repair protein MutS [Granulicatella sp. zg-ZJ]|uniref:DNA mismatch repair protein MutS n=1 Tax=Granulicatella sp. zg-ZJ TaxID=2678504 RepID=UPI0013D46A01|nr:DNA mismatch repair protein MutS [Granulicatella sp. zg-ZJ]NEW62879.1 DNA mismatch repair protein MutS [Granulicatella sp. zg-ZJ]